MDTRKYKCCIYNAINWTIKINNGGNKNNFIFILRFISPNCGSPTGDSNYFCLLVPYFSFRFKFILFTSLYLCLSYLYLLLFSLSYTVALLCTTPFRKPLIILTSFLSLVLNIFSSIIPVYSSFNHCYMSSYVSNIICHIYSFALNMCVISCKHEEELQ